MGCVALGRVALGCVALGRVALGCAVTEGREDGTDRSDGVWGGGEGRVLVVTFEWLTAVGRLAGRSTTTAPAAAAITTRVAAAASAGRVNERGAGANQP
jgi:hypothetical protein